MKGEQLRMTPPAAVEVAPSVKDSLAFCPTRMGYIDTDHCLKCTLLVRMEFDREDNVTGLVCAPTYADLLGGMSI